MKTPRRNCSQLLHPPSGLLPLAPCLLLLAILLLASFLRFYRLDAQSFWNDEGNSARIAERPLDLILEGAEGDIHPPGYYLLLHTWRALFGQSEFALRSLSVVAGLALVVLTYLLGRHLFGEATGLIAAFLGAISPFAIYYSQEARMYALLAALSAASTYLLLHLLSNLHSPTSILHSPFSNPHSPFSILHSPFFLTAYILTSAAGLYTQYAFPFVLLAHNVTFGLWWLVVARRSRLRWRAVALWAGVQVVIAVLYLPWLPIALKSVTGWSSAGRPVELGPALLDVLHVLAVGITLPVEDATVALVGTGLLLALGLWPNLDISTTASDNSAGGTQGDRAGWFGVASMAIYLLLPIALIFAFDLYKPAWLKFLVVVLPPFHILIARGVDNLASRITHRTRNTQHVVRVSCSVFRVLLLLFFSAVLAVPLLPSLQNLYLNPAYARDNYRQIASDIAAVERPGDSIILNAPNQWEVFTYYYPDQDVHPAPYRPEEDEVAAFLAPLVQRTQRLFVLYWGDAESDPHRLIETWLAANTYKASDRWYGRVRLATYGVAPLPQEPAAVHDARLGEHITLRGHALAGERFAPSDVLPVTLFWDTQAPIAERYKVTVQLLDAAGQLVAQRDSEPGDGLMPTTTWEPGHVMADRYGVLLPPDLAPGRYTLIAGLYQVTTGARLPVQSGGDHVILCDVEVDLPAFSRAIALPHPHSA